MQFRAATWEAFGVDGDRDGKTDRYDPADAISSAARYLQHNGAPTRMHTALYRYNHSQAYVNDVLARARTYAHHTKPTGSDTCQHPANLSAASGTVGKIIAFAMAQRGKRYDPAHDLRVLAVRHPCPQRLRTARRPGLLQLRTRHLQQPARPRRHGHLPGQMVVARCSTCIPNIGVQSYKRSDWTGVTRPLLRLNKAR